jgi:hypothetical protein
MVLWSSPMKSRTLYFPPSGIAPGMTLAKSIIDRDGHTLLTAGTVLTLEMLDRLVRRGVEAIAVTVADMRDDETIERELETAQSRVGTIFRGPGSPARDQLRSTILNYRQEYTK